MTICSNAQFDPNAIQIRVIHDPLAGRYSLLALVKKIDTIRSEGYSSSENHLERIDAMKVYSGTRTEHGAAVVVEDDGEIRGLDPRFDLKQHSPTGFEWGNSGSGPAQLSLALAADVLGDDERAQTVYQSLRFKLIGRLPKEEWILTEKQLRETIEQLEKQRVFQL